MIRLRFTNGTQYVDLKYVRNVQWSSEVSEDALVSGTTRVGARKRVVSINGFINNANFRNNILAQQRLETDLIAVGTGTIEYVGGNNITNVRFKSLKFSEFRGNPIAEFSVEFVTEDSNVHAHEPVGIGSLTLSPANGYEYVTVSDKTSTQGPDEQLVSNRNRTFTISGSFIGSTLAEINTSQAALVAAISDETTVVLTLSAAVSTFAGSYTVRPGTIDFGVPRLKDNQTARSFTFECKTFEDYTKEPYTLGETPQAFANIELDVVESVQQKRTNDKLNAGNIYAITAEDLSVSGKKYFATFELYTDFRDTFNPVPTGVYTITSTTANVLELQELTTGKFTRDGNYADGSKRYSASISMTFRWDVGVEGRVIEYDANYFGLTWYKIESANFSSSVDENGNSVSKGVSVTGKLIGAVNITAAINLLGTKVDYSPGIPNTYVTSVNLGSVETQNVVGSQLLIYSVTITAKQLDNATQASYFIQSLFRLDRAGSSNGGTIQFDKVSSLNKSFSNRYDQQLLKFVVTSVNLSVSGEIWSADTGTGSPTNPNRAIDLFNQLDALISADLSTRTALSVPAGETLPDNGDVHFILTNFSLGDWTPFTKQSGVGVGTRYWKQTISLSATAVFDLSGGTSTTQPDLVETTSRVFEDEAPKYQQLQVVGFGTVFKRVGTTPAKETATSQRQYRDLSTLNAGSFPADPSGPSNFPPSKSVVTKRSEETRGTSKRVVIEWSATDKIS